jgi:uncharacterized ferritin-like protein (DUF455 family)
MNLRDFADTILLSESLEQKLQPIEAPVSDDDRGPADRISLPARPEELRFCGRRESPPMPHPKTFRDPLRRACAHHIMANHELQALEVMAFVLRAFPDAPAEFRLGLARIMADEQRHTRMHLERLESLGMKFGDLPVNGYFWLKAQEFITLLDYLAGLPLTFEGRNLDHTLEFERAFRDVGDEKSAAIMRVIHSDEIGHVAFGLTWLRALKDPRQTDWEAYTAHLKWPLAPKKARGKTLYRAPRLAAGMPADFIDLLEHPPHAGE